jgi:hypothetical protein
MKKFTLKGAETMVITQGFISASRTNELSS